MHFILKKKYLYFSKYKLKCSIGKRGIKKNKKEGDKSTPRGTFALKSVYYRKDRVKKFNCKIKLISITRNMGWCDDAKSSKYNKLIRFPFNFNAEKLFITKNIYDYVIVINYNVHPVKKNKGSAIFLHIATKNYKSTNGCIAVSKKDMKKIIRFLNYKSKITIV